MVSSQGLSSEEAARLLGEHGPNTIEAKKVSFAAKTLRWLISPMSLLLLVAAGLSFYIGRTFDGWFILALFLTNFIVAQWHESKADQAIATLQRTLTVSVTVLRDGAWCQISSDQLVPGDLVKLGVGNVISADILITESKNLSVNTAALTGESLPQERKDGDTVYTGSFITTGSLVGTVSETGSRTKFGKTVTMVDDKPKNSVLEKDIVTISKFLTAVSIGAAVVITGYLLLHHQPLTTLLTLDLSILIAGVPVAMPTVMSLIISLGVLQLTRKHVIVRRLSSLEDLANVNLLLSDKTGTLTKNEIQVEDILCYGKTDEKQLLQWARAATTENASDPINQAVIGKAAAEGVAVLRQIDTTPADSKRKRSTAVVEIEGKKYIVSLGAPQIVESLCDVDKKTAEKFHTDVEEAARQGYRALAVARARGEDQKGFTPFCPPPRGEAEQGLTLLGLLLLSDTLRPDAETVIRFLEEHGIQTKIMTGDNRSIAARVGTALGIKGEVFGAAGQTEHLTAEQLSKTGVFAEVLPDDKFRIVQTAAKHFIAAATGDGVNDLPALKEASVGIAVKNAVDALRGAADIVLLTDGIGVIRDAIIEARKIFTRTYYYSVYRISESFRLILTIAILSIANGTFPLTPVQIILLALLNDLPIITLAYDRVTATAKPSAIHVRERFGLASLYGFIGIMESISLFYIIKDGFHLHTSVIQTMFFLKLTVSGHLLIYVAHTTKRWWKFLPSKQVITATLLTQLFATVIALGGFFFQGITLWEAALVWGWALLWMQGEEIAKQIFQRYRAI